jgi:hypothetical protein
MDRIACLLTAVLALGTGVAPARPAETAGDGNDFFEKKIRPVLVETCSKCHNPEKKKGNLLLDSRAAMLKGGDSGPAIMPGHPARSLLIKALRYSDDALRMPPKSKLPDAVIADFTRWVQMGAPWPEQAATAGPSGKEAFNLQERRKHWSFQPIRAYGLPAVRHKDWPQSPIDYFILARLEQAGLSPAPAADKRTLLRRVTYDLIGLPPTPAEIDAFLADSAPDAFARVVDRLLASPHYGERWGRHWLDLVRFAETQGHEYDFEIPEAYAYRDYVIRAFNADVPYDRFVTEHVAGDLVPDPRRLADGSNESIVGTGFWFLGEAKHSPVDIRVDEADRLDNQIDVFSKTFLGLTVACARCHDHKFDAISSRDYYALMGYLESSRYQRAFVDRPEHTQEIVRRLQELQAQACEIAVAVTCKTLQERNDNLARYLLAVRAAEHGSVAAAAREHHVDTDGLNTWFKALQKVDRHEVSHPLYPWLVLARSSEELSPLQFTARRQDLVHRLHAAMAKGPKKDGRAIVFEDFHKGTYQDWFVTGEAFGTDPSRMSDMVFQPDPRLPVKGLVGAGVAHSGRVSTKLRGVLRSRTFTIPQRKIWYHMGGQAGQINLIIDGYQLIRYPIYGGLTITTPTTPLITVERPWAASSLLEGGDPLQWHSQDVSMWVGHKAYVEIIDDNDGFVALDKIIFADHGPPAEPPSRLLLQMLDDSQLTSPEKLAQKYQDLFQQTLDLWRSGRLETADDPAGRVRLLNWMLQSNFSAALDDHVRSQQKFQWDWGKLAPIRDRYSKLEAGLNASRRASAMADGSGWNEHVYVRGNPHNLGPEVPRRFLEALAGPDQPVPAQGSGRLALARRMVAPSDPLLPRVMVNRIWQHHFGAGIVRSPDNFGVLGERPTHPELLDYLATQFVRQGWSIKQLQRLLLLSSTYQMASRSIDDALDPENKLLHHMPLRRLEAESIRDALLAVSGGLDRTMFGPGVMPHLTPHMVGRGRPERSGPLDGAGRRSVYLNLRRNFLPPMFLAFDYPIPFTTMGRRSVSNVPAQALALMNNPFVVQQADLWARRILAEPGLSPSQRVTRMYETAFGRLPDPGELADALAFLDAQAKQYGRPDDARAWADLCHVLFNVKEFIFIG